MADTKILHTSDFGDLAGLRRPIVTVVRYLLAATLAAGVIAYFVLSWRWPLVHDAQIIHYVVMLIGQGRAPYRQIGDMNMPGAYLTEMVALHLFGVADLGWRLWDFTLALVLIGAMISIARRYDWIAGLIAGSLFTLLHGSDRAVMAGQRDQVIAVCLIVAWAFCFESVRLRLPWLMLPFGFFATYAATIKPTMLLAGPVLLLLALLELRRLGLRRLVYVVWAVFGFVIPLVIVTVFLLMHGSMQSFFTDLTLVLPSYAGMGMMGRRQLIMETFPGLLWGALAVAALLAVVSPVWRNWEQLALGLGMALGFFSYYAQRKGFVQHRYEVLAFTLLWVCIQLMLAFRSPRIAVCAIAVATLLFLCARTMPYRFKLIRLQPDHDLFTESLESDLIRLGPSHLRNNILCLDVVTGCVTALFHLQIGQINGSTGDLAYFTEQDSVLRRYARDGELRDLQQHPPAVIVLTNVRFLQTASFDKINTWPAFTDLLSTEYIAVVQREFPPNAAPTTHTGAAMSFNPTYLAYRIYIRRGDSLLSPSRLP